MGGGGGGGFFDDAFGDSDTLSPRGGAAAMLPPGMSHAAVTIASRVQWVVATVGVARPAGSGGSGMLSRSPRPPAVAAAHNSSSLQPRGSIGTELEEVVFVWAVDGLHAEGAGMHMQQQQQRPGQGPARGAAGPRAVLWGREARRVAWLQPQALMAAKEPR
jgi:hypothetical protein